MHIYVIVKIYSRAKVNNVYYIVLMISDNGHTVIFFNVMSIKN